MVCMLCIQDTMDSPSSCPVVHAKGLLNAPYCPVSNTALILTKYVVDGCKFRIVALVPSTLCHRKNRSHFNLYKPSTSLNSDRPVELGQLADTLLFYIT